MFCPNCGNKTSDNALFCAKCGFDMRTPDAPVSAPQPEPQPTPQAIPSPPPVYVQPAPQMPEKKGSMGIVVILVIIAVIIGIGIGVVMSYMNNNQHKKDYLAEGVTEASYESVEKAAPQNEVSTDVIEIVHTSYKAVKSDDKWTDANFKALEDDGRLVSINSEEEFDKVCSLAEEEGLKVFWVGARRNSPDLWEDTLWSDKSDLSFTRWFKGEPTYVSEEGEDEKYLMVFKVGDKWYFNDAQNDVSSFYSGKMGYIIEYTEYEYVTAEK